MSGDQSIIGTLLDDLTGFDWQAQDRRDGTHLSLANGQDVRAFRQAVLDRVPLLRFGARGGHALHLPSTRVLDIAVDAFWIYLEEGTEVDESDHPTLADIVGRFTRLEVADLRRGLLNWTDVDVAEFLVGQALGAFPPAYTAMRHLKWMFWSANPIGDALHGVILRAPQLEYDADVTQARWRDAAEEERLLAFLDVQLDSIERYPGMYGGAEEQEAAYKAFLVAWERVAAGDKPMEPWPHDVGPSTPAERLAGLKRMRWTLAQKHADPDPWLEEPLSDEERAVLDEAEAGPTVPF